MKGALAYSVNTVAVKLIDKAGVANTVSLAQKMGINSEMRAVPSIALGSANISLLEMTAVYSCFANEGITSAPYFIKSIEDLEGKMYDNFKSTTAEVRVMKKETAQLMTSMLRTVVHEGTASRLRWRYGVYTDVAGKTGTTQSNADGWFMGVTPGLVIGTWVGADDPRIRFRSTELGQGSNTALPIAAYFLQQVNKDPNYKKLSDAKFPSLSEDLQEKLDCDLYELSDSLTVKIEHLIVKRDSTLLADTLAVMPETFLQGLYQRKQRLKKAAQQLDSLRLLEVEALEGNNE
jgi:penicillin-binding protein 1A